MFEALVQLLRGDLPLGALRADAPAAVVERCKCNEQANKACRVYTEAWPASLAWLDGAPLASHELQPCPDAPHFRLQFFHMYQGWTHEENTRDTMVLVPAHASNGFGAGMCGKCICGTLIKKRWPEASVHPMAVLPH